MWASGFLLDDLLGLGLFFMRATCQDKLRAFYGFLLAFKAAKCMLFTTRSEAHDPLIATLRNSALRACLLLDASALM